MRIDAHQHFWRYSPTEHTWMSDDMMALKRDFLPEDLKPLLTAIQFDSCVAVQARQSIEETRWLLDLAEKHEFIRAVVGWVDLRSEDLAAQLESFARNPKLAGVRHVVQDEPDDEFMLRPQFRRGISRLQEFNLTYDLLLFPKHLPVAVKLVEAFPEQRFALDHLAKPKIAERLLSPWREDLKALAGFPNVYCKLSGMVTEAKWNQWQPEDFNSYLDIAFSAFGPNRLMIGSDWPVCTLSAAYEPTLQIVFDYVRQFPAETQAGILGANCGRFYGIESPR